MALSGPDRELFAALAAGSVEGVRAALAKGASANAVKAKRTAFQTAAALQAADEILLALIEAGADVGSVPDRIVWAVSHPMPVLERFLAAGADVNTRVGMGTPVQLAARLGELPKVRRLIEAGADLDAGTLVGNALSESVLRGHYDCALALLQGGAKPGAADAFQAIVPMLVELGQAELVAACLDAGADPDKRYTIRGLHAREKQAEEIGRGAALRQAFQGMTAGPAVVPAEPPAPVADDGPADGEPFEEWLKRFNADLEAKVAARSAVRLSGVTALIVAALEGSEPLVELLLSRGADPLATDDSGRTALSIAEAKGDAAIAARLGSLPRKGA